MSGINAVGAIQSQPMDIVAVAIAIRAMAEESRERQMKSMKARSLRRGAVGEIEPSPWQEIAIRVMEDRGE